MIAFIAGMIVGAIATVALLVLVSAWDDKSGTSDRMR